MPHLSSDFFDQSDKKTVGREIAGKQSKCAPGVSEDLSRSALDKIKMLSRSRAAMQRCERNLPSHLESPRGLRRRLVRFLPLRESKLNRPRGLQRRTARRLREEWSAAAPPGDRDHRVEAGGESLDCGPSVPVPLQGASTRARSKAEPSSSVVASIRRHSILSPSPASRARNASNLWLARLASNNARVSVALGEDQRLAARRSAGVENSSSAIRHGRCRDLCNQLRAFILNARTTLAIRRRRCHVA